jgi:Caspase domain
MAYFLNDQERLEFEQNEPPELKRADIWMISGCEDRQTSADVSNVGSFQLPDSQGQAGGACSAALLNVLYEDEQSPLEEYSFTQVMEKMRVNLRQKGFKQIPQLSSTRPINMEDKFKIVPDDLPGTKRAVLIGINYVGAKTGELRGCHNDVFNMVRILSIDCWHGRLHHFPISDLFLIGYSSNCSITIYRIFMVFRTKTLQHLWTMGIIHNQPRPLF